MFEIQLPIFFKTEKVEINEEIGINYSLDECEIRLMTFYSVNAVSEHFDNEKEYSMIYSNSDTFVCNMKKHEVINLIRKQQIKILN